VSDPNPIVGSAASSPEAAASRHAALPALRWLAAGCVLLAALGSAALVVAWNTQQRVKGMEQELVRRQLDSGAQAAQAQLLARQAQEAARESAARLQLLDVRVADYAMQRSQLEELIQSLSRTRDENVLADVEAAVRMAMLQSEITGSPAPLLAALRQSEERVARLNEPRLDRVRRALADDLERVRAIGSVDIATLVLRLDEAMRQVDDLPLLSQPDGRVAGKPRAAASAASVSASAAASAGPSWQRVLGDTWGAFGERLWSEVRSLVRVTRIDQPEAMLLAPEQVYFLRENLKLRLLNARLALLSRQYDTAQLDLRDAQSVLQRYFDRSARRVAGTLELLRQSSAQARQVSVPRPEATLAAIAAASAGR
jgi:uroporphyrin-3 C-methyltransferase